MSGSLPFVSYRTISAAFYIIPIYTLISPLLIWFIIHYSQRVKVSKLSSLTHNDMKENDIYFKTYTQMWH
ncbi:hypothetical protein OESDEN_00881 [Oesophagostomum dentatum]|uniref:Uncharacterized protein n=1 Tax=Oesophagostomum dentatum TaxID=61180 RepID=A0A0B1TNQ4_OESDE|nr:hypothetical protein OESDEN_00881 [Oesophagostomum dentatum]